MALTSLFSGGIKAQELLPRSIDLSGNIFQFSLPEDFSRDMPAANMVERLDIRDHNSFDDPEYGNLMRRWWDIKEPGWFGKRLGTTMMDLSVQRVAANTQNILHARPYSIGNRLDFMLMLIDRYHQRYDSLNEEVETPDGGAAYHSSFVYMVGERIASTQREYEFNHQKWIRQDIGGPNATMIFNYVLPLSEETYLDASFTYSPNDNVVAGHFLDTAMEKMRPVLESFHLQYAPGNPFADLVGGEWLKQTNQDLIDQHREKLVKLFHSPAEPPSLHEEDFHHRAVD